MRYFIDTEFTDFLDCELISIAIVREDGRAFYGEVSDFTHSTCSAFVLEAVLPQLRQTESLAATSPDLICAVRPLEIIGQLLHEWLLSTPSGVLCYDFPLDVALLQDALLPAKLSPEWTVENIAHQIDPVRQEAYYKMHGGRHHALHDARALHAAFSADLQR